MSLLPCLAVGENAYIHKCDGRQPKCCNCVRRGESCEYTLSFGAPFSETSFTNPKRLAHLSAIGSAHLPVDLDLQDYLLLHHFQTAVSSGLSAEPRVSAMWQSSALLEAGSHAHLMHSLLGLSALHIAAHSGPQVQKWHKIKAYQHQTQALSTQRAALPNLSAENCVALCFTAVVLVHFELAVPFTSGFGNPVSTLQRLITISDLSRGHYSIFSSHDHIIRSGPMGAMINRNAWDDIIWELEPDVGAAFDTLEGLVDTYSHDESVASEYRCAVQYLRETCAARNANEDHPSIIFMWVVLVSRGYFDLLRKLDPLALVILAHFGALVHLNRDYWLARDWGYHIVEAACALLDPAWRPLTAWVQQRVCAEVAG